MRPFLKGKEIILKLTQESKLLESMDEGDADLLVDWIGDAINGNGSSISLTATTRIIHKLAARGGVIEGDWGQDED